MATSQLDTLVVVVAVVVLGALCWGSVSSPSLTRSREVYFDIRRRDGTSYVSILTYFLDLFYIQKIINSYRHIYLFVFQTNQLSFPLFYDYSYWQSSNISLMSYWLTNFPTSLFLLRRFFFLINFKFHQFSKWRTISLGSCLRYQLKIFK